MPNLINPYRFATGGGGYDADAADYFSRAEALGGSFDQSGSGYSEATVKGAISNFVATCKTDGTWSKITEAYLFVGTTFSGIPAKLKDYTSTNLALTNFVSGDYVAVGSGAGLKGNASNKGILTDLIDSDLSSNDRSVSSYQTECGTFQRRDVNLSSTYWFTTTGDKFGVRSPINVYTSGTPAITSGYGVASHRSASDRELYVNGTSEVTVTTSNTYSATSDKIGIFADAANNNCSNARQTFVHLGSGLTDTEASNLSTAVNTLMTALGCNVY